MHHLAAENKTVRSMRILTKTSLSSHGMLLHLSLDKAPVNDTHSDSAVNVLMAAEVRGC